MTNVEAREVDDIEGAPAGAFEYVYRMDCATPVGMAYMCPCGCGHEGYLGFRPHVKESPSWAWDDNVERPTLEPSVHHVLKSSEGETKTHWHGWLRNGVWQPC